jgi:hypothetical protein
MRYCSWEGREFPESAFELDGGQHVHKDVLPRHNTLGELVDDNGELPNADLPLGGPDAAGDDG